MAAAHDVRLRRVYDDPETADGFRVLVDRVWPRGLSKERAHVDEWMKQVAPSTELRTWYRHTPEKWAEFQQRYHAELADPERSAALERLRGLSAERTVTILTASKALDISQAAVLVGLLTR